MLGFRLDCVTLHLQYNIVNAAHEDNFYLCNIFRNQINL